MTRGSWTNLSACARRARRHLAAATMVLSIASSPLATALGQTTASGTKISTELLVRVLEYRTTFMESRTPLDACSLYRLMENPADFPGSFPRQVLPHLNRRDAHPCGSSLPGRDTVINGTGQELAPQYVRLDSLVLSDSIAKVHFSVLNSWDALHNEEFTAQRRARDRSWVVIEARIFGLIFAEPRMRQ